MIFRKQKLIGASVTLEPLSATHLEGLRNIVLAGNLWKMKETIIPHPEALDNYSLEANASYLSGNSLVYAIIDTTRHHIAGCTRFRNINASYKKAVIGPTFIGYDFQRTHVNTEAKFLMLNYAFEHWRFNRIEFVSDVLNSRSRHAIQRLGAKQEGILRNERVMPDGRIRDSVLYRIIKSEWPEVKIRLEEKREQCNYLFSYLFSA